MLRSRYVVMPARLAGFLLTATLAASVLPGTSPARSEEAEPTTAAADLIADLCDDDFATRQRAADKLAELAAQAESRAPLARAVWNALGGLEICYEARRQLERLTRELSKPQSAPSEPVSDEELDRLVARLNGDTYADRVGAASRLSLLVEHPGTACRVIERLRPLRRSPTLLRQTRERIEPIWERAQLVWLTSDPKHWQWPAVADTQIAHWLDLLTRPLPPPVEKKSLEEARARLERRRRVTAREIAREELLALLVRDDLTARVRALIDECLAGVRMDDDARKMLNELLGWTRPWMAMEGWTERRHVSLIELPVGVSYQSPKASKPTLFDRVDDRQAHCASDTALPPGDYPVGVLFPHPVPLRSDSQFIIYNLDRPRLRLAYHYRIKHHRDERLPELSERTLARLAAEKRPLKQAEFIMLASLDARAVSRFAGKYLLAVGDPPPADKLKEERAGRGSPHLNLCNLLVEIGTHEALPGLLEGIRQGKLPRPTAASPANWPWIAALTIMASDPGPNADRILPELISRTDPLVVSNKLTCDVGATAAAILVDLHGEPLTKFGLELVDEPLLAEYGGLGYRFNPPEMRQKVLRWWKQVQNRD